MSIQIRTPKDLSSEMNVTPLIDVLLVLLIIFMVLLPRHYLGEKAEIPLPVTDQPTYPEPSVLIRLLENRENRTPNIKVNDEEVTWQGLERHLREIYQLRAEKVAFVTGDPEIEFENIAQVIDISHRAGVDRIGLMRETSGGR